MKSIRKDSDEKMINQPVPPLMKSNSAPAPKPSLSASQEDPFEDAWKKEIEASLAAMDKDDDDDENDAKKSSNVKFESFDKKKSFKRSISHPIIKVSDMLSG